MAVNRSYQQYQQNSVMTASPGELTLMLYNGCIKFIKQAMISIDKKDIEQTHNNIVRAQDIIMEFMSTLNMDYDVSQNLMQIYEFMKNHLAEANAKKDKAMLEEVLELVTDLRNTWNEALKLTRKNGTGWQK